LEGDGLMREATERRKDGMGMQRKVAVLGMALLSVIPSFRRLSAQVGHDPGHSPYHDLPKGAAWVATFGYLGGSRGSVGVGISDGATGGIRYEVPYPTGGRTDSSSTPSWPPPPAGR